MRAVRLLLVGVLGLLGSLLVVTGAAGPAAACSCVMSTTAQQVRAADVVVTGVLEGIEGPPQGSSSLAAVGYRVAVESTYKGEPRA